MAKKRTPPTNVTLLRPKLKDPTSAARSRRFRQRRKEQSESASVTATVAPAVTQAVSSPVAEPLRTATVPVRVEPGKINDIKVSATARNGRDATVATVDSATADRVASVTVLPPERRAANVTVYDLFAMTTAIGLASIAGYFSVSGMAVLFPGKPVGILIFGTTLECGKLATAAWLARHWGSVSWISRAVLAALILLIAGICAAGVYSQLISAYASERGATESTLNVARESLTAKIDQQAHAVADLDGRIGLIDASIAEAAKRGRTKTALDAMESQRRLRAGLVDERKREAATLVTMQAERAQTAAKGQQIKTEAMPIQAVAAIFGVTDPEIAIRWLVLLMTLACDPLAIALTWSVAARRRAG